VNDRLEIGNRFGRFRLRNLNVLVIGSNMLFIPPGIELLDLYSLLFFVGVVFDEAKLLV
jgi:hypothetical protein